MKKAIIGMCLVSLILGLASCEKHQDEPMVGGIQFIDAELRDSIPSEYGRLVGVTSSDTYEGWAQLWFEKEDKTIVVVAVNFINGSMRGKVANIPRS